MVCACCGRRLTPTERLLCKVLEGRATCRCSERSTRALTTKPARPSSRLMPWEAKLLRDDGYLPQRRDRSAAPRRQDEGDDPFRVALAEALALAKEPRHVIVCACCHEIPSNLARYGQRRPCHESTRKLSSKLRRRSAGLAGRPPRRSLLRRTRPTVEIWSGTGSSEPLPNESWSIELFSRVAARPLSSRLLGIPLPCRRSLPPRTPRR